MQINTKTPEILDRARQTVEPALQDVIKDLNPDIALAVRYHFGWVDKEGNPAASSGKGIRPALAVLSAEFAGKSAEAALPGAVAVELVHNFSLLHDDVIDKDLTRRHRPTVWKVFGIEDALLAGDALLALAFQVLLESSSQHSSIAAAELAWATSEMISGQRADMSQSQNPTLVDCQKMESQKTGALLACSSSIGAVLAGGSNKHIDALKIYGKELGLAFQAVDDYLGIWGDPEITGKPAGNDIRERKKSVPIVLGLEKAKAEDLKTFKSFSAALSAEKMKESDIQFIVKTLEDFGAHTKTLEIANQHLNLALSAIMDVSNENEAVRQLEELAHFVISRDH